jgi:hypothetical protein
LWRICEYIHISDCVEVVYGLLLLLNNAASETFCRKSGAVRSVYSIFITGSSAWRGLGKYVTSDKTFYSLLFKQEVVATRVTASCLVYHIPRRGPYKKYNNFKMNELHDCNMH